jgi:hypothetical protein
MNRRHLLMAAGLALSAALAWFGNPGTPPDIAEAVVRGGGAARPSDAMPRTEAAVAKSRVTALPPAPPILALLDRRAVSLPQRDGHRPQAMFSARSWAPPAAAAMAAQSPLPAPAPTAPPLPFTYIGKQSRDGQLEVFLAEGEKVHVLRLHSLVETLYRVDAIGPNTVSFTYLPLNATQMLSIGASD